MAPTQWCRGIYLLYKELDQLSIIVVPPQTYKIDRVLWLTMDIVVELQWWHIPVNGHITPRLAELDNLFALCSQLPILLGAHQASRQSPLSDLKQVSRVVPDPHWTTEEKEHASYHGPL